LSWVLNPESFIQSRIAGSPAGLGIQRLGTQD
jgi:hypothetical protein